MKKPSTYARKRAKSTLFGRVLCRLVGEQTGAVMMEYVVIAVVVVAAAVAIFMVLGKTIRKEGEVAVVSIVDPGKAGELATDVQQEAPTEAGDAVDQGNKISNKE